MPRGRPRCRGRVSTGKAAAKASPACSGRNRRRPKLTGSLMKSKSAKAPKSKE